MERVRVRYLKKSPGLEKVYLSDVAKALAKRGEVEIIGEGTPKPRPEKKEKRIDRDKLVREAIDSGLGTKEELLKLSDSELAQLVGEDK
jgi:hypothetical protein